jgi:hypothetical protein
MLGKVCARGVEKSPMSVMGRGTLDRVLGADQLDAWFARTAQKPEPRPVVCATVSAIRSPVVVRIKPSVRAASRAQADQVGASRRARAPPRNGGEPHTAAELGRSRAVEWAPWGEPRDGARAPWVPGERIHMMEGHGMAARARRLTAVRTVQGGAVPGPSVVG